MTPELSYSNCRPAAICSVTMWVWRGWIPFSASLSAIPSQKTSKSPTRITTISQGFSPKSWEIHREIHGNSSKKSWNFIKKFIGPNLMLFDHLWSHFPIFHRTFEAFKDSDTKLLAETCCHSKIRGCVQSLRAWSPMSLKLVDWKKTRDSRVSGDGWNIIIYILYIYIYILYWFWIVPFFPIIHIFPYQSTTFSMLFSWLQDGFLRCQLSCQCHCGSYFYRSETNAGMGRIPAIHIEMLDLTHTQ